MKTSQNKGAKKVELPLSKRRMFAKWSVLALVVCAVLAYYCTARTYGNPFSQPVATANYTMQNLGIVFIILEAIFAFCLKGLQDGAYWFSWLQFKKPHLDERQTAVRRRVFERSYAVAVIALFVLLPGVIVTIGKYAEPARTDFATYISWIILIIFISLPSILASWQKDSA